MQVTLWKDKISFKFILKLDHQLKIAMYVDQEVTSKILHSIQDMLCLL